MIDPAVVRASLGSPDQVAAALHQAGLCARTLSGERLILNNGKPGEQLQAQQGEALRDLLVYGFTAVAEAIRERRAEDAAQAAQEAAYDALRHSKTHKEAAIAAADAVRRTLGGPPEA